MINNNNLSQEWDSFKSWVAFRVWTDISSLQILNCDVLDIESDIVSWSGFNQSFVMHFHWLDVGSKGWGSKGYVHSWFQNSGFNSADWHSSNTTDFVDVLQGKSQWLFSWSLGRVDLVQSFHQSIAFVPSQVGWSFQHVITVPSWNRDEVNFRRVVANFFQVILEFLHDFFISRLGEVNGLVIHLVEANNHLLNSQSVC